MEVDFIGLCKLGVGPVLVRHSDIILMEPTPTGCTRLDLSYGDHLIVEEDLFCILQKIKSAKLLSEQSAEKKN